MRGLKPDLLVQGSFYHYKGMNPKENGELELFIQLKLGTNSDIEK